MYGEEYVKKIRKKENVSALIIVQKILKKKICI